MLLDTFFVRTIIVPAMMYTLGGLNWWPRAFAPRGSVLQLQQGGAEPGAPHAPEAGTTT